MAFCPPKAFILKTSSHPNFEKMQFQGKSKSKSIRIPSWLPSGPTWGQLGLQEEGPRAGFQWPFFDPRGSRATFFARRWFLDLLDLDFGDFWIRLWSNGSSKWLRRRGSEVMELHCVYMCVCVCVCTSMPQTWLRLWLGTSFRSTPSQVIGMIQELILLLKCYYHFFLV